MPIDIGNDIQRIHAMGFLDKLLMDKTTGRHILWATDTYASLGDGYSCADEIRPEQVAGTDVIRPRSLKAQDQQSDRTRQHGEVFTPLWVCRKMCDYADKELDIQDWKKYVDARVLEITCGEAPFLVSRYNSVTGEAIHVMERIGLLDRKLQAVDRNADTEDEWLEWTFKAFRETYGYEFQGDNLLIARVNLLATFEDYLLDRWGRKPTESEYTRIITVIVWNFWQMDGLKGTIPYGTIAGKPDQISFSELMGEAPEPEGDAVEQPPCWIYNWRSRGPIGFLNLTEKRRYAMKFDFIIGNPPYQEEAPGESTSDKPIYHFFMDSVYGIASKVELITPARFLFNAGNTPKSWNKKMLQSRQIKVLDYEPDSKKVFSNTAIMGGIAVTYYDESADMAPIEVFVPFMDLNNIRGKVLTASSFTPFGTIISGRTPYLFTDKMHEENPSAKDRVSKGHLYDVSSDVFNILSDIFASEKPNDENRYYRVLGRLNSARAYHWIKKEYVRGRAADFVGKWKVFLPSANGASGVLGESAARMISKPVLGAPDDIATDTFIVIGPFTSEAEANAALKYVNSKFARALLGILKITQHNTAEKWKYVPLQDFAPTSDIDWSKPIPEIDRQLYAKYGLDDAEIEFIESHVKEME